MTSARRADRPFVDRPVTDRVAAERLARAAAFDWGLAEPHLLRVGMNALYSCGDVVLRVGSATAPAVAAHRLARWLIDAGVPTIAPVDGLATDRDGLAVTGWEFVPEARRAVDWESVGAAVRQVHDLDPADVPDDYPAPSPTVFTWWRFDELLDDVGGDIDAGAAAGLRRAVERHRGWEERIGARTVLCHGDVHPGNVLVSAAGPLLVDWDLMCVADPAWDHAMLTTLADRWGGDRSTYDAFLEGYGAPAVDADLARALGILRNVAATLLRVRAARSDDRAVSEAQRRLAYWRGESDEPWSAQ